MNRLFPALMLLAMTAAAQAQTAEDRFPKPSRENPSAVQALKKWLGTKTGEKAATKPHPAPAATASTHKLTVRHAVAIRSATATSASQPTLKPTLASAPADNPLSDEPVPAVAISPSRLPAIKKTTGCQRIISAYYAQGRRTASGAAFNPHGLTAAHRTLPFGTRLVVTNPRTGKSVTVTVNDRGPFVRGVSLDLSLGAAKVIGMHGTGAVCMARM